MECSLKCDLSVMCLTDLFQWGELYRKTGAINVKKKRYREKDIFGGRQDRLRLFNEGWRTSRRVSSEGSHIDLDKIKTALLEAQNMKIPFTQRLLKMNYFSPAGLRRVIERHAQEILLEAATWTEGSFEFFQGELPSSVLEGPIKLNTSELIQQMCTRLEDSRAGLRKNISFFYIIK